MVCVRVAVAGRDIRGDGVPGSEEICADVTGAVVTVFKIGVVVFGWDGPQATSSPTSSGAAS